MICERCKNVHDGQFGSGRFCSLHCANKRNLSSEKYKQIAQKLSKEKIKTFCPICQKFFIKRNSTKSRKSQKTCSLSCGMKLRYLNQDERNKTSKSVIGKTGGWRNFGGNGIKGIYKGYLYQSSWELAWIYFHINKNIKFKRCKESFSYSFEGKERKYFPDFYLEDDKTYVEIKGYPSKITEAKLKAFPKNLKIKILYRKEITPYLQFMKNAGVVY